MSAKPRAEITAILFTDLVGSTELMQQLGDDEAQGVFSAHYRFLRDTIVSLSGILVEWTGDGVMATFGVVTDAIQCAVAIQQTAPREAVDHPLDVRAGINVGEILRQETGSGYFGTPLVIARRLCDLATPGQILCSTTVAGLLAGSQAVQFRELGKRQLKGIAEPVVVAEVAFDKAFTAPSLQALRRFLRGLPDLVVATDPVGRVVFFNPRAEEVLGYSSDEVLGRPVMELYPSPEEAQRVMAAIRDPARDGPMQVRDFSTKFLSKARAEIPVRISGALVEGLGTIGVSRTEEPTPPTSRSGRG